MNVMQTIVRLSGPVFVGNYLLTWVQPRHFPWLLVKMEALRG